MSILCGRALKCAFRSLLRVKWLWVYNTVMMKTLLALMIGISVYFTQIPAPSCEQSRYALTDLGAPTQNDYAKTTPRNPWDMQIYQGKLYIGAGDYDANSGNTPIYALDLQTQTWERTGTILNEAAASFAIVDDTLYIPGTDPTTSSWAYGNYYHKGEDGWELHNNLPGAVHHFDLVRHQGDLFFGIGTANANSSPVKVSKDYGNSYQDVAVYREGKNLIGNNEYSYFRVYNFFTLKGDLYCLLAAVKKDDTREMGFCQYTGGAFHSIKGSGMRRSNLWQVLIGEAVTLKEQCYFATGRLYRTEDFHTYEEIVFPEQDYVTDCVAGTEYLYVLTAKQIREETYVNTLWRFVPETGTQVRLTDFQTEGGFGLSLEKEGASFFVGIGHGSDAGRILKIQPKGFFTRLFGLLPPDR